MTGRELLREAREALDAIAGGHTSRFPGAPDVMSAVSPEQFRSEMWTWSQSVARDALARIDAALAEPEDDSPREATCRR